VARTIQFFPTQMNMGGDVYSQIFDVTDCSRIDADLRVYAVSGTLPTGTATLYTTSDPTFDNSAWTSVGSVAGTAVTGYTAAFSGFGRFVRMKFTVNANCCVTACVNAVGREP
jgi:hypothetical protein